MVDYTFVGTDADEIYAGQLEQNRLLGNGGNDTLSGSGDLAGGAGADTLTGGGGADLLWSDERPPYPNMRSTAAPR
jgi:Ca2+-binding RTX toxin-like protein